MMPGCRHLPYLIPPLVFSLWAGTNSSAGQAPVPKAGPQTNAIRSQPLKSFPAGTGDTLFENLSAARTGIDFVHRWNDAPRYQRLLNSSTVGGGVAVGDYDGDGQPDICLTRPS